MSSNPARDLAATGTGPWSLCRTQYGPSIEHAEDGEQIFIESYGITYTPDPADAEKIVRAVNALPAWADYDDAVMAFLKHQTECHIPTWCPDLARLWREFTAARDRVADALTGNESGPGCPGDDA